MFGSKNIVSSSLLFASAVIQIGCSNPDPAQPTVNNAEGQTRQETDFNFGWKFIQQTTTNGQSLTFDDSQWREVRLPHDWSIESAYTQEQTAGATGYLPGGEGWYRKHFATPLLGNSQQTKTQILFDGIYNHSEVWINGHSLGKRPSGYAPFYYDLTPHLTNDGSDNVLAVYVDRTRYVDSRWYTGSGIYRNVKLITTGQVHLPIWGTTVTTPTVTPEHATVVVEARVKNDSTKSQRLNVTASIVDAEGQRIVFKKVDIEIDADSSGLTTQELILPDPLLWDIDSPNLYFAHIEVRDSEKLLDSERTRFGVRTLKNDPNEGFFLNGRNLKIQGVNLHHDAGLVGAAVPKGVWQRRLQALKQAGVNAIRTAHNPASEEFLELCDEMGFLVQEETFDEWDNPKDKRKNFSQKGKIEYIEEGYSKDFAEWAEQDLKAMLLRDKNHPSIFQWSIGNEIEWSYPKYAASTGYWDKNGKMVASIFAEPPITPQQSKEIFSSIDPLGPELADTAAKLAKWTRDIDTTRPVIANMVLPSVSHYSGYVDALDIAGYSYRQPLYDYGHRLYPDKLIMGTENFAQWHEWKAIIDRPYIPGIFIWTGIDYMGEADGRWPYKGAGIGMLDFAGFTRPRYHMMKSLWDDSPHIYVATKEMAKSAYRLDGEDVVEKKPGRWRMASWRWPDVNDHWNYQPGELVSVEVYTNLESVELFQNGVSLGVKSLTDNEDHIIKWAVPYQPGTLQAKSAVEGIEFSQSILTASEAVTVDLTVDKTTLSADGYDVAHVVVQLVDKNGVTVNTQDQTFTFIVDEKLRLLGVDNGASNNVQPHKSNVITSHKGRALLIVQSKDLSGLATVAVTADGLKEEEIQLELNSF
jgi:beta-galactosidase/beta-glucuronidase